MKVIRKKICLLGEFAVGKTSLVKRFIEGRFDERYLSTIGVKISRKTVQGETHQINLYIWDLAGGDNFSKQESSYLRGATGALIICDLTREDTIPALKRYTQQLRKISPGVKIILIGNKSDLVEQRVISDARLEEISQSLDTYFIITSAKSGENIESAFISLTKEIEASL